MPTATRAVHLAVLWAFAVVQPVFSVIEGSADFFVARDVGGAALATLVVAFAVVPPMLLLGLEALVGRVKPAAQSPVELVVTWGLFALLALVSLNELFPSGGLELLLVSAGVGVAGALAYVRLAPLRSLLTVLAPAPVAFVVIFLFFSPVEGLIVPGKTAASVRGLRSDTPVVFVVFDELPLSSLLAADGRIDARRYPSFGRLARESTWFRNTAAAADQTVEAVPAVLTGTRPRRGTLPILSDYPGSVFTLLGDSHRVTAMEHASLLCPRQLCRNSRPLLRRMVRLASALSLVYAEVAAPDGLRINFPPPGTAWEEVLAARNPEREIDPADAERADLAHYGGAEFARFLQQVRRWDGRGRPPFYFLHSSLPHFPTIYLPSGRRYASFYSDRPPGLKLPQERWSENEELVAYGFQRHLLQVGFVDRLLGHLISKLRRIGLYDSALLVVTADHGAAYVAGANRRRIAPKTAADIGSVPLFVKAPGQRSGRVLERQLQTTDVLPTLADALGTRVPWRTAGRSGFAVREPGRRKLTIFRHDGPAVSVAAESMPRQRRATVARQTKRFGSGRKTSALFALSLRANLVGARVADLPVARARGARARVEDMARLKSVDLSSAFVPALVKGKVEGQGATEVRDVAVAINGRVAGTGRTYSDRGAVRFSLVVTDAWFRSGQNQLRLFRLYGRGRRALLVPLALG